MSHPFLLWNTLQSSQHKVNEFQIMFKTFTNRMHFFQRSYWKNNLLSCTQTDCTRLKVDHIRSQCHSVIALTQQRIQRLSFAFDVKFSLWIYVPIYFGYCLEIYINLSAVMKLTEQIKLFIRIDLTSQCFDIRFSWHTQIETTEFSLKMLNLRWKSTRFGKHNLIYRCDDIIVALTFIPKK